MPLSSNTMYGVEAMTTAVNKLPATQSTIRDLGIFTKEFRNTTYVKLAENNGQLSLVKNSPRGTPGEPVKESYGKTKTFEMLHLQKDDNVFAEDVQNVKAFGSNSNKAITVGEKVARKLAMMRGDVEYTREHLMLGALEGKLLDADAKTMLVDIYEAYGLERKAFDLKLSSATADISMTLEDILAEMETKQRGESVTGWTLLGGREFLKAFKYHKSIKDLYTRFNDTSGVYRDAPSKRAFNHMGIDFIQYNHTFPNGKTLDPKQGILLPMGTRSTFAEFFAPADTNDAVNTEALEFYAQREVKPMNKGWNLEVQSNPLPMLLRPELVATITMS